MCLKVNFVGHVANVSSLLVLDIEPQRVIIIIIIKMHMAQRLEGSSSTSTE